MGTACGCSSWESFTSCWISWRNTSRVGTPLSNRLLSVHCRASLSQVQSEHSWLTFIFLFYRWVISAALSMSPVPVPRALTGNWPNIWIIHQDFLIYIKSLNIIKCNPITSCWNSFILIADSSSRQKNQNRVHSLIYRAWGGDTW